MSNSRRTIALMLATVLFGAAFAAPAGLAQEEGEENETQESEANETEEAEENDTQESEANETEEAEANDTEEAEDEDEREEAEEERSVEVQTEGKDVSIELKRETEPREDKVEMAWNAEDATFELAYESENETRETEDKLEAMFGAIAEYRDANNNSRYDPGEELVSGWMLGDEFEDEEDAGLDQRAEWGTPTVSDVTRDGKDGKRITTTAQLGGNGTLTLRLFVFGSFVNLNGTDLSPTGAKIDIVIDRYDFQANDTDLALFLGTETESEYEQEVDDEGDETGVSARNASNQAGPQLVFTWKDTAQVDGQTRDVATTVLEEANETEMDDDGASNERERAFVLSYPRGDEIVHDPRAEVVLASAAGAASDVPGPGLAALLASIAGVAVAAHARRP